MIAATVVERACGTAWVHSYIYDSAWFAGLWGALALCGLVYLFKRKLYERPAAFAMHLSFVLILLGALTTSITAKQGEVHLLKGHISKSFTLEGKDEIYGDLPAEMKLDTFFIRYYSGTHSPSDYVTRFTLTDRKTGETKRGEVSMNHIYSYKGYRFYQLSYDPGGEGSHLSVNADPYGITITYYGYFMLFLSMLALLIDPKGGFSKLLSHPLLKKSLLVAIVLMISGQVEAQKTFSREQADELGTLHVLYNGRITSIQTVATDLCHKWTGRSDFHGYSPMQILCGIYFNEEDWITDFRASVKETELLDMAESGTFFRIFPQQTVDGTVWYAPCDSLPTNYSAEKKLFIQESLNLLAGSTGQDTMKTFHHIISKLKRYQQKNEGTTVNEQKLSAERFYNKIPFTTLLYRLNLLAGILSLVWCGRSFARKQKIGKSKKWVHLLFQILLLLSFGLLTVALALRSYISGEIPMTNGYETMLVTAWCVECVGLFLRRRFILIVPFALLLSGFLLLVADISHMDPQITPLIPVLSSPLLCLHVSVIMMAYALLALTFFNGATALFFSTGKEKTAEEQMQIMQIYSKLLLYPAVVLLSIGIFVGAIWANVSWGKYWSWDPKESWALITLLVYALPLHDESFHAMRRPFVFHLYVTLAFLSVLITYFGVNYFLGGMHGYAN